jgi:hypothetical protein
LIFVGVYVNCRKFCASLSLIFGHTAGLVDSFGFVAGAGYVFGDV